MDPLMPLAAGVMCVEGGLPRDESIALTAAALVIQGPLALAPALIAVERHRNENASTDPRPTPVPDPPKPKVGPALVLVPDVVGKDVDVAVKELETAKLKSSVEYSDAIPADDKKVLGQNPVASAIRVAQGRLITLQVGMHQPDPPLPADEVAIKALREDVDSQFSQTRAILETMAGQLKDQKAQFDQLLKKTS